MSNYSKEYYEKNKEKINARNRERYQKVKDTPEWKAKNRESSKKWREEHPDRYKEMQRRYRAKKKVEKELAEKKANSFFAKLKRIFKRGK